MPSYSISVRTTGVVVRDDVAIVKTCFSWIVYGRKRSVMRGFARRHVGATAAAGRLTSEAATAEPASTEERFKKSRRLWVTEHSSRCLVAAERWRGARYHPVIAVFASVHSDGSAPNVHI